MPKIKSPSIGRCIYCDRDSSTVELTCEHVVPLALDGQYILVDASCKYCAKVTGAIEQACLRGMLLEARTHLGMKTRRPKERPTTFPAFLTTPDGPLRKDLPLSENPFLLRLPLLADPPILIGNVGGEYIAHLAPIFWTFIGARTPEQRASIEKIHSKEFTYAPTQFALFLAKIAHCSAVFAKGYGNFEPLLPSLIITRSQSISDFVGRCAKPHDERRDTSFHMFVANEREFITAELCMFAHLGAPYYKVIVGKRKAS